MGRLLKQTVDYFPHSCTHGKTMFILEQKFGNNGYAFWFKLLEILGQTPGHFLDLNDVSTWEFLQAKTLMANSSCDEILNLLSRIGAIDSELWEHRVVWSQNFVNRISSVYANRRVEIPGRPDFYKGKNGVATISTTENTHSKVKESKVKKSRVEEVKKTTVEMSLHNDNLEQQFPTSATASASEEEIELITTGPPSESENDESLSEEDQKVISVWRSVKGFKMTHPAAMALVAKLRTEFPEFDLLAESKAWAARKISEPLTARSRPSGQIWNWLKKAREFGQDRSHRQNMSRGKLPPAEEVIRSWRH